MECIRTELCIMYECIKHVTLMLATKGAWIPTGTNTDKVTTPTAELGCKALLQALLVPTQQSRKNYKHKKTIYSCHKTVQVYKYYSYLYFVNYYLF